MRLKLALLALTATTSCCLAADYGAIAYSQNSGATGWSYDFPDRGAAERKALSNCKAKAADCQIAFWFYNSCGALAAASRSEFAGAYGEDRADAETRALRECSGRFGNECSVKAWACNTHRSGS